MKMKNALLIGLTILILYKIKKKYFIFIFYSNLKITINLFVKNQTIHYLQNIAIL